MIQFDKKISDGLVQPPPSNQVLGWCGPILRWAEATLMAFVPSFSYMIVAQLQRVFDAKHDCWIIHTWELSAFVVVVVVVVVVVACWTHCFSWSTILRPFVAWVVSSWPPWGRLSTASLQTPRLMIAGAKCSPMYKVPFWWACAWRLCHAAASVKCGIGKSRNFHYDTRFSKPDSWFLFPIGGWLKRLLWDFETQGSWQFGERLFGRAGCSRLYPWLAIALCSRWSSCRSYQRCDRYLYGRLLRWDWRVESDGIRSGSRIFGCLLFHPLGINYSTTYACQYVNWNSMSHTGARLPCSHWVSSGGATKAAWWLCW